MTPTCRMCGMTEYIFSPWYGPVEELCGRCNHYYANFYSKRKRLGSTYGVRRDEQVIVEFIAHQLEILATRYKSGKSIIRCEWSTGLYDQCWFYSAEEIEGHNLCTIHSKIFKRTGKINTVKTSIEWINQTIAFFNRGKAG